MRKHPRGGRPDCGRARTAGNGAPAHAAAAAALTLLTAIPEVLDLVLLDVAIMLVERRREGVSAVVAADEVEILDRRRIGRGFERRASGRCNRPGGQSGVAVGVVGRVELEIFAREIPVVASRP